MYKILLIEDDHGIRQLLSKTLSADGHQCLPAANAAQGLELCARQKPDLIVLDVHLPDGNGIDLCRTLKADAKLRHIPILIMTGEAHSVESKVEGLEAGADDYMLKPFGSGELSARVRGLLAASVGKKRNTDK